MITAVELGHLPLEDFVTRLSGIYEKSPWVVERAFTAGPFDSLTAIHKVIGC